MSRDLVTIRTFWSLGEAEIAAAVLRREGIEPFLSGAAIASMYWIWTNAIGGIRLQVADDDVERAGRLLEEAQAAAPSDEVVDDAWRGTTDGENLEEGPRNDDDQDADSSPGPEAFAEADAEEDPLTQRERDANRAFKAAVFGLFFLPIQLYTLALLFEVAESKDRLATGPWVKACAAFFIMIANVAIAAFMIAYF